MPRLIFTEAQSKLFGELKTSMDATVDEWFANFVITQSAKFG